jgi:eukaryotic-like serine/threonine-protein kinase
MARPTLTNDLLDLLRKCGLDDCVRRLTESDSLPDAPRPLAEALVRDGLLTRFLADQLLQGEWRNLTIGGKDLLREKPARGSMGAVYLCDQPRLRRRVALKALHASQAGDPAVLERFEREGRAVAALDHPNLVKVHDVDQAGKLHFLVLEFVDGSSLHDVVRKGGPLDAARAAACVRQAALGLQHAHAARGRGWSSSRRTVSAP